MESLILYESPYNKIRLGRNNDGGYVIADLPGIYEILISGGISDDVTFEQHWINKYQKPCYAYDGTINALPVHDPRITFVKKNLGSENTATLTNLEDIISRYSDIFMKIDIEGHEFRLFPSIFQQNVMTKIKQLVLEIHSPKSIALYPNYYKGLADIVEKDMFDLIKTLNTTHTLIHLHANNGPELDSIEGISVPTVFELTYIRNDFVLSKVRNTSPLPTPLDMKNVLHKPDYSFKGYPYTS